MRLVYPFYPPYSHWFRTSRSEQNPSSTSFGNFPNFQFERYSLCKNPIRHSVSFHSECDALQGYAWSISRTFGHRRIRSASFRKNNRRIVFRRFLAQYKQSSSRIVPLCDGMCRHLQTGDGCHTRCRILQISRLSRNSKISFSSVFCQGSFLSKRYNF